MKAHFLRSINGALKLWKPIASRIAVPSAGNIGELSYWRERSLQVLVSIGLLMSFFVLVPSVLMLLHNGQWSLAVFDTVLYAGIAILMLMRRVHYAARAVLVLFVLYFIGLWIILSVGILSGGPAWLFAFAVIAGILLGLKAAVLAIVINTLTLTVVGWLIHTGTVAAGQPFFPNLGRAVLAGINFLFLNAIMAISIAAFTRGLQAAIARAHQAQEELQREIEIRKQTTRFLQESEEKYRLIAENISDILWSVDMDFNFTYISPAAQAMLGWSAQEFSKLSAADILTSSEMKRAQATIADKIAQAKAGGSYNQSATMEIEMKRRDGSTLLTEVRAAFIRDSEGNPTGILGVTRDISERIKNQREKETLQAQLIQSKKMESLGLLASGVAHDLNNVLSGIVSYPDLLLSSLPAESPLRKPLETIRATGTKAAEIVQDLLTLARRGVNTMQVVSLNAVVQDYLCSPEYTELIKRHPGVEVRTRLSADLFSIQGSAIHLKKAVMNLVINAAEAQPQGGTIDIETGNCHLDRPLRGLAHMPSGDYARLAIADQGTGIADEDLKRIFEPFFTRKVMGRSGTGLGMAVVWGTVEDHCGGIVVQSRENQGTLIELYFPQTCEKIPSRPEAFRPEAYMGNHETILIVDDSAEQRQIAADMLLRLAYRPLTVPSGEAAVAYVQQHRGPPIKAVILDMIMAPGMDGLDTYRCLTAWRPGIKALIASGFSETERVRTALREGVGAYIKKPYMLEDIGLALKKLLSAPAGGPQLDTPSGKIDR